MSPKNDAAFLRMFLIILGALVAFTVLILFVANKVAASDGEDPHVRAAVAERIAPVGRVNIAPPAPVEPAVAEPAAAQPAAAEPAASEPAVADDAPAAPAAPASAAVPAAAAPAADAAPVAAAAGRSGQEVYNAACTACHLIGVLGAPKLDDTAAWSARLDAAGIDGLVSSVINGKGNMPARAGANISDAEIRVAVDYILNASGVEQPASAPAAATPAQSDSVSAAPAAPAPAVAEPAAAVAIAAAAPAESAPPAGAVAIDLEKGKTIYDTACFACHATGAAGAPKLADQALWGPRIAKGLDTLTHNAINGIGAMPAKGGRVDLPDADIASAVVYMIEQAK